MSAPSLRNWRIRSFGLAKFEPTAAYHGSVREHYQPTQEC